MTSDLLARLRRDTASEHRRVEDLVGLGESPSAARYRDVLARFLGFYEPLEARLDAAGVARLLSDWPARRKAGWLARDLALTGLDDAAVSSLPRCRRLPDLGSPERALGCCYVLEGATLGGGILARDLAGHASTASLPLRFFSGYGADRGRRWHSFRAELRAQAGQSSPDAQADVVAAARETFAAFADWLRPLAPVTR